MATPSNVLNEARALIERRLSELNQERQRLEKVLSDLAGGVARRGPGRPRGSSNKTTARRGPGRPKGSRNKTTGPVRRRSRKGGTRREQALKLITSNPGITASEIAKQMKIAPNYVYRVMGDLQKDKSVRKQGRGYHAA